MESRGPKQDWNRLDEMPVAYFDAWLPQHRKYQSSQWERIVWALEQSAHVEEPFEVNQLHHALQMATRMYRANRPDELVLIALCHDMGKVVGYQHHGEIAAEMLRPYVSETSYHVVRVHQDFECYHVRAHDLRLEQVREKHRAQPWFEAAMEFCEWDQSAFDPKADAKALEEFLPLVKQICQTPSGRFSSY